MRDALNATGRPIYYSICEIGAVKQTPVVLNSPSSCGRTGAYTSLEWIAANLDVKGLANSVLIEWVNNNNYFCREKTQTQMPPKLMIGPCIDGSAEQVFIAESDGSIRHAGSANECMDVYNCQVSDGTSVALYKCHPNGTAECGYKNQQWKYDAQSKTITNVNSKACLTLLPNKVDNLYSNVQQQRQQAQEPHVIISACKEGDQAQIFELTGKAVKTGDGKCLMAVEPPSPPTSGHCCRDGWVSQIDSQQDLTLDTLSGPGYWNDNDMLSVGCNEPGVNGTAGTPCAGFQTLTEQRAQFALWCIQASPLILGHDVTKMGKEIRSIITNPEMLALNQDPLGYRARIVYQSDPYNRTLTTFVKKLSNVSSPRAAAIFNRGSKPTAVVLTRKQMGFAPGECLCVNLRDVDVQKDISHAVKGDTLLSTTVQSHEVKVIRAICC